MRDKDRDTTLLDAALAVILGALVIFQGGFDSLQSCLAGAVAAIVAVMVAFAGRGAFRGDAIGPLLLAGVGCSALVGGALRGMTLGMVAEASTWFALAGLAGASAAQSAQGKRNVFDALCWMSLAVALLGALELSGWLPLYGDRFSQRLEFPFQYANASGIYFAVLTIICSGSDNPRLRAMACVPMLATMMTRSVGALAVLAIAVIALAAWETLSRDESRRARCSEITGALVISLIAFGLHVAIGRESSFILMCATGAASFALSKGLGSRVLSRRISLAVSLTIVVAGAAIVVIMLPDRLNQASQTFIERLIQIEDGLSLLGKSPIWGIGPDMWAIDYPFAQTAQYQASQIHCSYLKIALDSGFVGLALFLGYVVYGLRGAFRSGRLTLPVAALAILAHALLDFDFSFMALLALLVFIIEPARKEEARSGQHERNRESRIEIALMVVCGVVCVIGFSASMLLSRVHEAGLAGDVAAVDEVLSLGDVAGLDQDVRTSRYAALLEAGLYGEIDGYEREAGIGNANQALLCASGLLAAGDDSHASEVLVAELEREPYNIELFEQAAMLLADAEVPPEQMRAYLEAIRHSNDLAASGNAARLANQVADLPHAPSAESSSR